MRIPALVLATTAAVITISSHPGPVMLISYSQSSYPAANCDQYGRYPGGTPCQRAEQNVQSTQIGAGQARSRSGTACAGGATTAGCRDARSQASNAFNAQQQAIYERRQLEAQDQIRVRRQRENEEAKQRSEQLQRANAQRQLTQTAQRPH